MLAILSLGVDWDTSDFTSLVVPFIKDSYQEPFDFKDPKEILVVFKKISQHYFHSVILDVYELFSE